MTTDSTWVSQLVGRASTYPNHRFPILYTSREHSSIAVKSIPTTVLSPNHHANLDSWFTGVLRFNRVKTCLRIKPKRRSELTTRVWFRAACTLDKSSECSPIFALLVCQHPPPVISCFHCLIHVRDLCCQ